MAVGLGSTPLEARNGASENRLSQALGMPIIDSAMAAQVCQSVGESGFGGGRGVSNSGRPWEISPRLTPWHLGVTQGAHTCDA